MLIIEKPPISPEEDVSSPPASNSRKGAAANTEPARPLQRNASVAETILPGYEALSPGDMSPRLSPLLENEPPLALPPRTSPAHTTRPLSGSARGPRNEILTVLSPPLQQPLPPRPTTFARFESSISSAPSVPSAPSSPPAPYGVSIPSISSAPSALSTPYGYSIPPASYASSSSSPPSVAPTLVQPYPHPHDSHFLTPPRKFSDHLAQSSTSSLQYYPESISTQLPSSIPATGSTKSICLNHFTLISRGEDILGTFLLDPALCNAQLCGKDVQNEKRRRKRDASGLGPVGVPALMHLETRGARISVQIGVIGGGAAPGEVPLKAKVELRTSNGHVEANLFAINSSRQVTLEVNTQQGDITVLIPPDFSGPIQATSKQSSITFLPALARRIRIIKSDDHDALVIFGQPSYPASKEFGTPGWTGDSVHLSTKKGKIRVGVCGEDEMPERVGFWQKAVSYLRLVDDL